MGTELIRALLIEDDPDDVLLLKTSLAKANVLQIKLVHAATLSSGLIQLAEQDFDVVLLDLNLPDSRGLETLTTIVKRFPELPVVVLSGLSDDATTIAAIELGAQDYLVKSEIGSSILVHLLHYAIERKQVESVLRISEAKYRALVDASPDGITLTDMEGKLVLCNQQTALLHGYESPEAMIGINVFELIVPEERQFAVQNSLKALDDGKVTNINYTMLRKDSSRFSAELNTAIIRDVHGTPTAFIGITRDITAWIHAMEAEKRLMKLKEEFIASVSHDLRTPLFSLIGYLDLLRNGKVDDAEVQKEFLTRAAKDVDRLLVMVNELLDISRLESDRLVLNWEEIDLGAVILEVLESFQEKANVGHISLTSALMESPMIAEADPSRMRRVLANLVENAIKFSEPGSKIAVSGKKMNGNITIRIIDQGSGIPEEDLSKVFDKFYQVRNPLKKNIYGTGLGLYISQQFVEAHGGCITVKSKLGVGSAFTVTIPERKER